MSSAPEKVFLHIGLHKTGTTFLQNVMRANCAGLREQDVHFSWGPGQPVQAFAVWDLQGRRPRGSSDVRIAGSWDALVREINTSGLPVALISEERLSLSTLKQVSTAVTAFGDSEVQVVVTARDLGRVAVSSWQETIKNDATWTWREFAEQIKDPQRFATNPARKFWLQHDLAKICETWESAVPAHRIHVVTVPVSGTSPDVLMDRFASVVGFDPAELDEEPVWNNETVGVAGTEVVRRINERLGGRLNQRQHDKVVKMTLVKMLAQRTEPIRFAVPPEDVPWLTDRAEEIIGALEKRGYPIVGDLDELRPQSREGVRRPDEVTDEELLGASLDALALLSEKYATAWWQRKKPDTPVEGVHPTLASRARGAVFRSQRKAVDVADHNPAAAKALGVVLKARDRARVKARDNTKD